MPHSNTKHVSKLEENPGRTMISPYTGQVLCWEWWQSGMPFVGQPMLVELGLSWQGGAQWGSLNRSWLEYYIRIFDYRQFIASEVLSFHFRRIAPSRQLSILWRSVLEPGQLIWHMVRISRKVEQAYRFWRNFHSAAACYTSSIFQTFRFFSNCPAEQRLYQWLL